MRIAVEREVKRHAAIYGAERSSHVNPLEEHAEVAVVCHVAEGCQLFGHLQSYLLGEMIHYLFLNAVTRTHIDIIEVQAQGFLLKRVTQVTITRHMQSSVRRGDTDILKQQALQVAAHPYAEPQRSGEVLQRYAKGICYILQYHGGSDGAVVNQSERPQLVMQQLSLYLLYVHLRVCKVYLCVRQAQRVLYEIHVSAHVLYIEVALLLKER